MGRYIEFGIGKATSGTEEERGRLAASRALSGIGNFKPSLAIAFISGDIDVGEAHHGILDIVGDCPLIGTSTAGEICGASLMHAVVVVILASPHMRVHVGMGGNVSRDHQKATQDALRQGKLSDYFNQKHYLNQMLGMSAPGNPASPLFMFLFTPGSIRSQHSLSHEIHTMLRKGSMNRIPIFGGSSADYFRYQSNFQIVNQQIRTDSVALALVESETLFGLGMSHGYKRVRSQAMVTRAEGHIVYEMNGRPAQETLAKLLNMPLAGLRSPDFALLNHPFAMNDVYGNSLLLIPERLMDGGAIQFAPMMRNNQAISLMATDEHHIKKTCLRAFQKAVRQGSIQKPLLSLIFSCALRKRLNDRCAEDEITHLQKKAGIPFCGFYTFGEQGLSDDGFPIYTNQSVSALVFADELNPLASLIQRRTRIYSEMKSQVDKKAYQIKAINRMGKIVHSSDSGTPMLPQLITELEKLLPWADCAFYLTTDKAADTYSIASASNFERFSETIRAEACGDRDRLIRLGDKKEFYGFLLLKCKPNCIDPDEEDFSIAEIVGQIIAGGYKKIEVNRRLQNKLQHIEILNQLGEELAFSMATNARYQNIVKHIRQTLKLTIATLWLKNGSSNRLIKEAMDADSDISIGPEEREADEKIAEWQMKNMRPYFWFKDEETAKEIVLDDACYMSFVSLPILNKNELRGVLNFFSKSHYRWYFQKNDMAENIDFLMGVSAQMAVFIENRVLYQQKTLNKEIHHRVKNNLQNIANLLSMQARRVKHDDARQALEDSISRIMSIAMVHHTLSAGDIEKVDIGDLAGIITSSARTSLGGTRGISLAITGPTVMLPSKYATTLALILNELVQNAIKHGSGPLWKPDIRLRIEGRPENIFICVQDNGPGFPHDFDIGYDGNLGMTIVATLIRDELKGDFAIEFDQGAKISLTLPLPNKQRAAP